MLRSSQLQSQHAKLAQRLLPSNLRNHWYNIWLFVFLIKYLLSIWELNTKHDYLTHWWWLSLQRTKKCQPCADARYTEYLCMCVCLSVMNARVCQCMYECDALTQPWPGQTWRLSCQSRSGPAGTAAQSTACTSGSFSSLRSYWTQIPLSTKSPGGRERNKRITNCYVDKISKQHTTAHMQRACHLSN